MVRLATAGKLLVVILPQKPWALMPCIAPGVVGSPPGHSARTVAF